MWPDALVIARVPCALRICLWAIGLPVPFRGQQWCAGAPWVAPPAPPPLYHMPPWGRSMEAALLTISGFSAHDCLMPDQTSQSPPIKPWPLADGLPVPWIHGQASCEGCLSPLPHTLSTTGPKPLPSTFDSWLHKGRSPSPSVDLSVGSAYEKRLVSSPPLCAQYTGLCLPAQTGGMTILPLPQSGVPLSCSHTWRPELPVNPTSSLLASP